MDVSGEAKPGPTLLFLADQDRQIAESVTRSLHFIRLFGDTDTADFRVGGGIGRGGSFEIRSCT